MTYYHQDIHDKTLRYLFKCQLTPAQIAARMDMPQHTVRRQLARLQLGVPNKPKPVEVIDPPARPIDTTSPMTVAFSTLGDRLTEVGGCYRLDGTPIRFFDLMREVNTVRHRKGADQIGPDTWRVKP